MNGKNGFTLVELLVVIAIIGVLVGITMAVAGSMTAKAENNAAAVQITKVLAACEKFKGDFGAYPGELSGATARDTARQQPRDAENANGLAKYLFKRIPGKTSDQTGLTKGTPSTWFGNYLTADDISKNFVDEDNNNILDYWLEKPLVYWLRYKPASNGYSAPLTSSNLKKKLTPELWSRGSDGDATLNCLQLSAYIDLKKCKQNHSIDEDNVGGDMNTIKK